MSEALKEDVVVRLLLNIGTDIGVIEDKHWFPKNLNSQILGDLAEIRGVGPFMCLGSLEGKIFPHIEPDGFLELIYSDPGFNTENGLKVSCRLSSGLRNFPALKAIDPTSYGILLRLSRPYMDLRLKFGWPDSLPCSFLARANRADLLPVLASYIMEITKGEDTNYQKCLEDLLGMIYDQEYRYCTSGPVVEHALNGLFDLLLFLETMLNLDKMGLQEWRDRFCISLASTGYISLLLKLINRENNLIKVIEKGLLYSLVKEIASHYSNTSMLEMGNILKIISQEMLSRSGG